jgi:hypothetical protein
VNSPKTFDWRWASALLVDTAIGFGALGCVLWGIWQLMQYDR